MKVLVTGATGFIGNQVVKTLHNNGHQTVVLTRNVQKAEVHLPHSPATYVGDTSC